MHPDADSVIDKIRAGQSGTRLQQPPKQEASRPLVALGVLVGLGVILAALHFVA